MDKVALKSGGMAKVLVMSGVQRDLDERAGRVARAAGPGMEYDSNTNGGRARATVWTATYEARYAEATGRALTRAMDAARD